MSRIAALSLPFRKMHGLGNDFVVLDARETPIDLTRDQVRRISDRKLGVGFDQMVTLIGGELAEQVREATLAIYRFAAEFAAQRGILIADTKLEFGLDEDGTLRVMDEMLTPDSSRFWPAEEYRVGTSPASFDKQFVRDYLETLDWNKTAPGPSLPTAVIEGTVARYREALRRLTAG